MSGSNRWRSGILFVLFAGAGMVASAETRILFISSAQTSDSSFEIYSMSAGGSNLVRITCNHVTEWGPTLSPDGYRIAYINTNLAVSNLFITDLHGHEPIAIGNSNRALAVQWGRSDTLYYLAQEVGAPPFASFALWRIGADGTGQARITTGSAFSTWPLGIEGFSVDRGTHRYYFTAFSPPDAFSWIQSGWVTSAVPDRVMAGSPPLMDHYNPAVSPDSARVAFCADQTNQPGQHRLYVSSVTGGAPTLVCGTYCGSPAWAPDGDWLAFTRATATTWGMSAYIGDIWRARTNGAFLANLTSNMPVKGACGFPTVYEEGEPVITGIRADGALTWQAGLAQSFSRIQKATLLDESWTSDWLMATGLTASLCALGPAPQAFYRLACSRADIKAWYPLTNHAFDLSDNLGPMYISNAPFAGGGIFCNGIYPGANPTNGCQVYTIVPTLDFKSFAASAQFMVTNAPVGQFPVFMMGSLSYRWAGVYLNHQGKVGLCINNFFYRWSDQTFKTNVWHEATLAYDAASQVCDVYLDGVRAVSYVGALTNGSDRTVGVTHGGNAQVFNGYFRQLRVFNLQ